MGAASLDSRELFAPVLETFAHALPFAYRAFAAPDGTCVCLRADGDAGGAWTIRRERGGRRLYVGAPEQPDTTVALDQLDAWRLYTNALSAEAARARATMTGDPTLAAPLFRAVPIIA